MSEKVLGFKPTKWKGQSRKVPVVFLQAIKEYCKEEIRNCYGNSELDQVEIDTLTRIQEWAEKQAVDSCGGGGEHPHPCSKQKQEGEK